MRRQDGFAGHGHLMDRAVSEVDELLRTLHPGAAAPFVAGIRGGGGIAQAEAVCQRVLVDRSVPAAIPDRLEPAVPAGCGQPDFDLDIGVGGRFQRRLNPAECGQIAERGASAPAGSPWRRECAGGHRLRSRNRRVGQRQRREALTRFRLGRHDLGGGQSCLPDTKSQSRSGEHRRAASTDQASQPHCFTSVVYGARSPEPRAQSPKSFDLLAF